MRIAMRMDDRAQQLRRTRTPFVHATVVRAAPPTSAHPGDEAILLSDGTIEGFVGGHCAQNSVRKAALGALQTNESVLLRVLPDGDVHFPEAPGACVVVNPCLSGGALEIFLVPQLPAPLVQVFGATPIADALVDLCTTMGYEARHGEPNDLAGTTAVVIASLDRARPGASGSRGVSVGRVTGVVLSARRSKRLGAPKQLLPYRDDLLAAEPR